jgi:hypothetical protein
MFTGKSEKWADPQMLALVELDMRPTSGLIDRVLTLSRRHCRTEELLPLTGRP